MDDSKRFANLTSATAYEPYGQTLVGTAEQTSYCFATDHDFAHAEVPAEGRVYLYCRKCGDVRHLEVAK